MTKKVLNQNGKYVQELINIIEPDFVFNNKAIIGRPPEDVLKII